MNVHITNIKDQFVESNSEINTTELLNSLCEVVLSMTDDEINQTTKNLVHLKESVKNKNNSFKNLAKNTKDLTSILAKEKQLKRVLNRIDTLNKEGTLRSGKRTSILSILPKLNTYSFSKLSELEERLSIF